MRMTEIEKWDIIINKKMCPYRYQYDSDPTSSNYTIYDACSLFREGTPPHCNYVNCPIKDQMIRLLDKLIGRTVDAEFCPKCKVFHLKSIGDSALVKCPYCKEFMTWSHIKIKKVRNR